MKLDLTKQIISFDGKVLKNQKGEEVTLKEALTTSILGAEATRVESKVKYERGELLHRLFNAKDTIDVSVDDLKILKDLSGEVLGVAAVKPVWDALEGK